MELRYHDCVIHWASKGRPYSYAFHFEYYQYNEYL